MWRQLGVTAAPLSRDRSRCGGVTVGEGGHRRAGEWQRLYICCATCRFIYVKRHVEQHGASIGTSVACAARYVDAHVKVSTCRFIYRQSRYPHVDSHVEYMQGLTCQFTCELREGLATCEVTCGAPNFAVCRFACGVHPHVDSPAKRPHVT